MFKIWPKGDYMPLMMGSIQRSYGAIITKHPKSEPIMLLHGSHRREIINESYNTLIYSFGKLSDALDDSDYPFHRIVNLDVGSHEVESIRSNSYIKLPEWIATKKAIINSKNKGKDKRFKWASQQFIILNVLTN